MTPPPPISTLTHPLVPYTTPFRSRIGSLKHRLPAGRAKPGAASLAVRPGAVTLAEGRGEGLAGRILHSAYLGDHVEYEVEIDVGTLFIVDQDRKSTRLKSSH